MNFSADSKVLVQGITETLGAIHVPLMLDYGTPIVAGIGSGHGGETWQGVPVFDLVEQAIAQVGAVDTAVIFAEPYQVVDAALEAIACGIPQLILITEGVPPMDMVRLIRKAEATETLVVGPDSPGVIVPGHILLGTHPAELYMPGSIGIISRSGSLIYEIAAELTQAGLGQSICVGIGGDRVVGSSFQQWLQILEEDEQTDVIVLVGEVGGDSEEVAAEYIAESIDKPVVAYIAGQTVALNRLMGHTNRLIAAHLPGYSPSSDTAETKINAFKQIDIPVAERPSQIPALIRALS